MSRQQAADFLGISTRSIDRYVKKGTLSYKKIANKVILSEEELKVLKEEFELLNQSPLVGTRESTVPASKILKKQADSNTGISEFVQVLTEKDKAIEEKNQLIYMLQRRIGEVETQLQGMVALPDLKAAKDELHAQIQDLEADKETLQTQVRKERMRNAIYVGLIVIAAIVLIVMMM